MRTLLICLLIIAVTCMSYRTIHPHARRTSKIPPKVFAGEIHFSRVPFEYWEHRIQMIKGLGLNALSVYVMWNYHEVELNKWDFSTENRNLPAFLDLAVKYNISVLLRPGPYVCAEWDFGGFPAYLLENSTSVPISLRSTNPVYLEAVKRYFTVLAPIIRKYDAQFGGPIVLLQIENEYGSFGHDLVYINGLRQMWKDLNVTTEQYHADGPNLVQYSHWTGGNIGVNGAIAESSYANAKSLDPNVFIFGGEIYPGWLTHWGESWAGMSVDGAVNEFSTLCNNNRSFSIYMVHGGTNFGFTAGANQQGGPASDYAGHVTSYDYDAPINEQGGVTLKYSALRAVFVKHADWPVPDPPAGIRTITIGAFTPTIYATLMDNLPTPLKFSTHPHFESVQLKMYNQGIVVYQIDLPADKHSFKFVACDYAIFWVNDVFIGRFNRSVSRSNNISFQCKSNCTLKILVEAMGHINYAGLINSDRKGLISFTRVTGSGSLDNWLVYKVPLDIDWVRGAKNLKENSYPVFGRSTFDLAEVGDVYINVKYYSKGYVWVNGRNLGRFWSNGPQYKLFCPGVWLKNKGNEIIVLELERADLRVITGDTTLKLGDSD